MARRKRANEFHPELPRYEVKSRFGHTLDMQPTRLMAAKVAEESGTGAYINEINPVTGTKRRIE